MPCPYQSGLEFTSTADQTIATFEGTLTASGSALSLIAGLAVLIGRGQAVHKDFILDLTQALDIDGHILGVLGSVVDAAQAMDVNLQIKAVGAVAAFLADNGFAGFLIKA